MAALGSQRGQAIVLDNPRDPLAIYNSQQQLKENNRLRQQQQKFRQQQLNDPSKLATFKYEDAPDLFKKWGQDIINKADAEVFHILQSNPNADRLSLMQQISGPHGRANKDIGYGTEVANLFKMADENSKLPGIDQVRYKENLGKLLRENPYDMDREMLENFSSLPMNFDVNGLIVDSVKDIKDQYNVDSTGQPTNTMFGQIMRIENNQKRFADIEKTLDYVLGGDDVTDIGKVQNARGNQIVDGVLADMAAEQVGSDDLRAQHERYKQLNAIFDTPPRTPEERMRREQLTDQIRSRVRPILEQLDQTSRGVKIQRLGTFPKDGDSKKISTDDYADRESTIKALQNPFGAGDVITPEAQTAAARIKSGKLGAQNVLDVKFTKGGRVLNAQGQQLLQQIVDPTNNLSAEEKSKIVNKLGQYKVKTAPSDKAVLALKVGTLYGELQPQDITIDLSDPGSEALINTMLTTSPNEKKILYPDFLQYKKGKTPQTQEFLDADEDEFLDE